MMLKRIKKKKRSRREGKKRPFSLIELSLSLSILALLSTVLGFETRDFYLSHKLQQEVKTLFLDIKKVQSLALSHQSDFEFVFHYDKENKLWSYSYKSDEPIGSFSTKKNKPLSEIKEVSFALRRSDALKVTIYSTGQTLPAEKINLVGKKQTFQVDLTKSPQIFLKKLSKHPG